LNFDALFAASFAFFDIPHALSNFFAAFDIPNALSVFFAAFETALPNLEFLIDLPVFFSDLSNAFAAFDFFDLNPSKYIVFYGVVRLIHSYLNKTYNIWNINLV